MKTILIVCPRKRDYLELSKTSNTKGHRILFYTYDLRPFRRFIYPARTGQPIDMPVLLQEVITCAQEHQVDAIIGNEDYISCILATAASYHLELPAPSIKSLLICQHKYHARVAQQIHTPQAVPLFCSIDKHTMDYPELPFPLFVKPTKSFFSIGSKIIHSLQELKQTVDRLIPPAPFLEPLNWCLKQYTDLDPTSDYLVAEELLDGVQTTVDGFVYNDIVTVRGIVDSVMYPGTKSFARFDYPSQLPMNIQKQMISLTEQFLHGIGFNHGIFNIEFFYNPKNDRITIIEINPRMASQFADLYQKVDGVNSYSVLVDLAADQQPVTSTKGNYQTASIFVLRLPEDHYVHALPTEDEIKQVQEQFPETLIELLAPIGSRLSACLQDGQMYRYACIHVGGNDQHDLHNRFKQIMKMLSFDLRPIG